MGSIPVIPVAYAISEPAPEPLPGPTGTELCFAQFTKSATIKKYPSYPISKITFNSKSNLSL